MLFRSVNSHLYPEDLMSSAGQYGNNYVIFYINVQESSKLVKNGNEGDFVPANQYTRITSDMVASEQNMTQLVTGQGALVAGKVALGGSLAGGGGMLATAVEAVGVGAIASVASTASRQTRRLKTAIALHIPNQLSIRYGMQYDEEDTEIGRAHV